MEIGERKRRLSRMIIDYLERNPDAADTPHGITQWWIEHEGIEARVEEVAEVLEDLRRREIVTARDLGNGNTLFRLRRQDKLSGSPCEVRPTDQ
jgi:hypothetical protein